MDIGPSDAEQKRAFIRELLLKQPPARQAEIHAALKERFGGSVHNTVISEIRREVGQKLARNGRRKKRKYTRRAVVTDEQIAKLVSPVPDVSPELSSAVSHLRDMMRRTGIAVVCVSTTTDDVVMHHLVEHTTVIR